MMAVNVTAFLRLLQTRCVWNSSACTAALQIYDRSNFNAAFLRYKKKYVWNCSVCTATLQIYDGCEFYRFSLFAKKE